MSEPLHCLNCQLPICPVDAERPPCQEISPKQIANAANAKLSGVFQNPRISAVISVYKPKLENLNRCVRCVYPQVDEIIVCADEDTPWPIMVDKGNFNLDHFYPIKFVRMAAKGTGYGRKANYGARHSRGQFLWFLNDDVFVEDNVGPQLLAHFGDPSVGAVTHTLRYPDGTLQFSGLGRPSGHVGFGHLDHKKTTSRFLGPVEQESFCGASVMIRRKAFYDAGCHDERFRLYSEDAAAGLALRKAGYRIIFDPKPTGVHIEHESTGLDGELHSRVAESQRIFGEIWGDYFRDNPDVSKLGTFQ